MSATNPHDAYFREVFSSPPRLAGLLRSVLPAGAADKLDLDALTLLPQRFVDPSLDDHEADLLAQVPLRGLPGEVAYLLVLVEHQSSPDRFMALRVLVYCTRILEQHRRDLPDCATLPAVVPVVVYNGERSWAEPRTLHGLMPTLVDAPELRAYVPNVEILLDALTDTPDDALAARPLDAAARAALVLLKHIRERGELLIPIAERWAIEVAREDAGRTGDLNDLGRLLNYLTYAAKRLPKAELEALMTRISLLDRIDTTDGGRPPALQWWEEGFEAGQKEGEARGEARGETRGEARGRVEGEARGLTAGERAVVARQIFRRFGPLPPALQSLLDAADRDALERYADRVLDAATAEEIFAERAGDGRA